MFGANSSLAEPGMGPSRTLEVHGRCHVGRVRKRNEDCIAIGSWASRGEASTVRAEVLSLDQPVSLVVSDGIGGHRAGNIASRMVVRELLELDTDGEWQREVDDAIWAVEQAMAVAVARDPQLGGMGATVAGVMVRGDSLCHYNVGDSRILLWRDGQLLQLSEDDRLGRSPVLTQAIGGFASPHRLPKNLHAGQLEWSPDDTLLVCSDGLSDRVSAEEIGQTLSGPAELAADTLVERALAAGGQDNIAVIVARLSA